MDGVYFENRVGIHVAPRWKRNQHIYIVTNTSTIIGEFYIYYEMTTPKRCHDAPTLMET